MHIYITLWCCPSSSLCWGLLNFISLSLLRLNNFVFSKTYLCINSAPGCQRDYESRGAVTTVALHPNQGDLISGDQDGTIRVWDLTANKCRKEMVPEGEVAIRSISVSTDASMMSAANSKGNVYIFNPSKRYVLRNFTTTWVPRVSTSSSSGLMHWF